MTDEQIQRLKATAERVTFLLNRTERMQWTRVQLEAMTDVSIWNDNVSEGKIRFDHTEGVDRDLFERMRKALIGVVDDEIDAMVTELGDLEMPL